MSEANSQAELKELVEKLRNLEEARKRQNLFRIVSLLIIIAIGFYIYLSVKGTISNFDKEEFAKQLQEKAKVEFQPEIEAISKGAKNDLLPFAKAEFKKQFDQRLPMLKDRLLKSGELNKEKLHKALETLMADLVNDTTTELKKEFPNEDVQKILTNLTITSEVLATKLEDKVADAYNKFETDNTDLFKSIARFEQLPESTKLSTEEAEKQMLASLLDLLKYEILPEDGAKALNQ